MVALFDEDTMRLLDNFPDLPIIDTTDTHNAHHCRRKWYLTSPSQLGLRERGPMPRPLEFGIVFHDTLDFVYSQTPFAYEDAAGYFKQSWLDRKSVVKAESKSHVPLPSWWDEDAELGYFMFDAWSKWAPQHDDFTVVYTEHARVVPIYVPKDDPRWKNMEFARVDGSGKGILVGGYYYRTDGLIRDRVGRNWVREFKTAARWWPDHKIEMDDQTSRYTALETDFFGKPIAGVVMDFFLKEAVRFAPTLKSGYPTTDMRKLAYVTADMYRDSLPIESGEFLWKKEQIEVYDALLERERTEGHPTLRRAVVNRTAYQRTNYMQRITDEFCLLFAKDVYTGPTAIGDWSCDRCPVYNICRQMEEGGDWQTSARYIYQKGEPMWRRDYKNTKAALAGTDTVTEQIGETNG